MLRRRVGSCLLSLLLPAASVSGQTVTVRGAVLRRVDSTGVAGVDVRVPELHLRATSDARGEFQLPNLPAGRWLIELRRIGFIQLDTLVDVPEREVPVLTLLVEPAPASLDTVTVAARQPQSGTIAEFEQRRRHATGRFITRDELRAMDDRNVVDVLRARLPGLQFQPSAHGVWAYSPSQQAPQALIGRPPKPCYTQIIVDRVVVYQATDLPGIDPPDISEYLTRSLDGVEYYSSPARTPAEFRTSGAPCGTLVLWTRRR
jgi:hypothetical protein